MTLIRLIDESGASEQQRRIERQKVEALLGYCETASCRRQAMLGYFGERDRAPCGNCDNCLAPPETWDGTVAAQKALSAVYRTGQRFGPHHLADLLIGNDTERLRRFGHERLKTFGVGAELDRHGWLSAFRQLLAQGYLLPHPEGHGGLCLAPTAAAVLRGERPVQFRLDPAAGGRRKTRQTAAKAALAADAEALWQALRAWRLEESRRQELPPYVIFHDATLIEVAHRRPSTLVDLAAIPGVGRSKLERYGAAVIAVVAACPSA
jgi:ATP-dependent DNA helicase RecQ